MFSRFLPDGEGVTLQPGFAAGGRGWWPRGRRAAGAGPLSSPTRCILPGAAWASRGIHQNTHPLIYFFKNVVHEDKHIQDVNVFRNSSPNRDESEVFLTLMTLSVCSSAGCRNSGSGELASKRRRWLPPCTCVAAAAGSVSGVPAPEGRHRSVSSTVAVTMVEDPV